MRKPVSARRQKKSSNKNMNESVKFHHINIVDEKESNTVNHSFGQESTKNIGELKALDENEAGENTTKDSFTQIKFATDLLCNKLNQLENLFEQSMSQKNKTYEGIYKELLAETHLDKKIILGGLAEIEEKLDKLFAMQRETRDQNSKLIGDVEKIKSYFSESEKEKSSENYINSKLNFFVEKLDNELSNLKKISEYFEFKQENELLLNQLHVVQEGLEKLALENQKKSNSDVQHVIAKKNYYGAAKHIKRQLPYRLGATMIAHSQDLNSLIKLPYALFLENKRFKEILVDEEQTSIDEYADAYEAERVKQHLSYALGSIMVDNSKSFKGWIGMPLAMHQAVKDFKKKQSNK